MSDENLDIAIGSALRQARLHRLRTQDELGEALHVKRTAISHYESGRRALTVRDLIILAQALGCQPADLLPHPYQLADAPLSPAIAQIVSLLQARPDLVRSVLDFLETRLSFEEPEDMSASLTRS